MVAGAVAATGDVESVDGAALFASPDVHAPATTTINAMSTTVRSRLLGLRSPNSRCHARPDNAEDIFTPHAVRERTFGYPSGQAYAPDIADAWIDKRP